MRKLWLLALSLTLGLASLTATAAETNLYSVLGAGQTDSSPLNTTADAAYAGGDSASQASSALSEVGSSTLTDSRFYFTYYYNDNSGDYYYGYVYAPSSFQTSGINIDIGHNIWYQPDKMGKGGMEGYYHITDIVAGYDSSYDAQEYITAYYDGDTGKTSSTMYSSTGQSTAGTSLYVSDRRNTAESGYVYDPSVPDTDAYFGKFDVTYYFCTEGNYANFLAYYITDLPYWNQPDSYSGSCAEVATAIVLSWWAKNLDSNLLSSYDANWQTDWPDNTSSSPSSYVSLIGDLASIMGWSSKDGTPVSNIGPGLELFSYQQLVWCYLQCDNYYLTSGLSSRSSAWEVYKYAISSGRPEIFTIIWEDGVHSVVGRGYWNDGYACANLGWGTNSNNLKLDWNQTSTGYDSAYIYHMINIKYYLLD